MESLAGWCPLSGNRHRTTLRMPIHGCSGACPAPLRANRRFLGAASRAWGPRPPAQNHSRRGGLSGFWLRRGPVEAFQHEIDQCLPTVEAQVAGQCLDVVEQAPARGQLLAQQLELVVHPLQHGVGQKGQDDEARQQGRQVLLAVAVVCVKW